MTYTDVENVPNPRRVEFDVEDYATLTITLVGGGLNATGVAADFRVTAEPNATKETPISRWPLIQGQRSDTGAMVTAITGQTITANQVHSTYTFNVAAFKKFRLTVSAMAAGPFDVIIGLSKVPTAFAPIPPLGTQPVSGTVAVTNAVLASTAAGLGKAEDAAAASGDVGIATLGVRAPATPAAQTSAAGDYGSVQITATGKQVLAGQGAEEHMFSAKTVLTSTTDQLVNAAPGAGLTQYVKTIIVANPNAANTEVVLKSGTTGILNIMATPGTTVVNLETPLKVPTNTILNVALGGGTVSAHCLITGYRDVA